MVLNIVIRGILIKNYFYINVFLRAMLKPIGILHKRTYTSSVTTHISIDEQEKVSL